MMKDVDGSYANLSRKKELTFADRVAMANSLSSDQKDLDKSNDFLIYIINKEVLFNGEISTITYFKDITFGVLYEQVKA